MYISVNGKVTREEEAVISPFDHGFMYGAGVFETLRIYSGYRFLFTDHFTRLKKSAEVLGILFEMTEDELLHAVADLLKANHMSDASVRINVSAGVAAQSTLQAEPYDKPNLIIYMRPLPGYFPDQKPLKILQTRRNTPETPFRLKSHHFLNNILAKRELASESGKEGLFLTEKGCIAECITSNIFWCKNRTVYTPDIGTGILNGITRQFIIRLCKKLNIKYEIGCFAKESILSADEVFMTNSVQEIMPVNQIDEYDFPGKDGMITRLLQKWYQHYRRHKLSSIMELTEE